MKNGLKIIAGILVTFLLLFPGFVRAQAFSAVQIFTYTGVIQNFTVPSICLNTMTVEAYGAAGGGNGGLGAYMSGVFTVTPGQVLRILVGGQGTVGIQGVSFVTVRTSGGGGSFVTDILNTPLVVAGGGGGRSYNLATGPTLGMDANITTNGNNGYSQLNGQSTSLQNSYGIGGVNGNGATNGLPAQGIPHAGNGGGFLTNGVNGTCGFGGMAFLNGGAGGAMTCGPICSGGFGGGGASGNAGAGGGGGYSGGGGSYHFPTNGGGGGSFNAGVNQVNVAGVSAGHGSVVLSFVPGINITASPPSICIGQSSTLTANGAVTYTWNNGLNTPSIVVSPTVSTTYTAQGTTVFGCTTQPVPITLTVNPLPSLTVTSNATLCPLNSVNLTASGASAYTWQPGNLTGAVAAVAPSAATVYSVTGMSGFGCLKQGTFTQTVLPVPTVVVTTPTLAACNGFASTLTAGGASTYTWFPGTVTGQNYTFTAQNPFTTTVIGTSALGCTASAGSSVTILPVPTLSFTTYSITCASLGSATVTASGGQGPYSYTWSPTAQASPAASGLNPGTYTLTVFDNGTSCTSTATTVFTSLIPLTGSLSAMSSLSCYGATNGSAHVTNFAGGSGSELYNWTDGTTVYTNSFPQTLGAGQWSMTVTDALTGCPVYSVFTITQPPALTLNIAASNATACTGTQIILTGTHSGGTPGYTYTWSTGPATAVYTVSEGSAGSYTYVLSSEDSYKCLSTKTISVDFIPNPTLTVSNAQICPQETGTLTVSGASTYTWSDQSTSIVFTDMPVANTIYTVIGSALGCTSAATGSIGIKQVSFPYLNSNSPVCEGSTLLLSSIGGTVYTWSGPGGFTATSLTAAISPVSPTNSGVYHMTVTSVNGCTASTSSSLTVYATPILTASGSTVCTSQTMSLSASSLPGTIFKWQGPLNFSSTLSKPSVANPAVNRSGQYTVKVTSTEGCTNTAAVSVSVVPPPSLTVALSSASLCSQAFNGSPNSITLTSTGASNYTLQTPDHLSNPNPDGPVSPLITVPPFTSGPATATLAGSNGVCTVTTSVSFLVVPNPTIGLNLTTPTVCAGQSFTYNSSGASTYTWGPFGPGIATYSTGQIAVANPTINSVFSVYGGSLGCNSAIKTTTITINPLPSMKVTPLTPSICLNDRITLSADGSGQNYSWFPPTGLNTMSGASVSASPASLQSYTVTATLNNCTTQAVVTVSVLPIPFVTASFLKAEVCQNEAVVLTGSGAEYYEWQNKEGTLFSGQTTTFIAGSPLLAGVYTLTATDKNGCRNKATTKLNIHQIPYAEMFGETEGCVPFRPALGYYLDRSPVNMRWEIEGKVYNTTRFVHPFTEPGNHLIKGYFRDTLTNCANSSTFQVTVYPRPEAGFKIQPENPVENIDEVRFINTSQGEEQKKWAWHFINDEGPSFETKDASYLFTEQGVYPVAMVVTNTWGCADTSIKSIRIASDLAIYVPNVFTPNGDGLNEVFLPVLRGIKLYELSIFDRWGTRLFFSNETQQGWDGSYKGEPCKSDVYVWKISVSSVTGEMKSMNGQVLLNR